MILYIYAMYFLFVQQSNLMYIDHFKILKDLNLIN